MNNNVFGKLKTFFVQNGPEILTVTGVVGVVAASVMACVATTKVKPVVEEHQKKVADITNEGTDEEKKERAKVYTETGIELVKLYAPAVILGSMSVASILTGNHILRKRNIALATAYATLDAGYKQYRKRVVEKYGEKEDMALHLGTHEETVTTEEVDENGKKKKVKTTVTVADNGLPSEYARYFVYGEARAAQKNNDYNRYFLNGQQTFFNQKLRANHMLFLNEVYEGLGIDQTIAGQAVGWIYDKNSEDHGDNYIDFGIQEVHRRNEVTGELEKVLLLDFNVDGSILNHAQDIGLMTQR